jgi:hypothetical protein
MDKIAANAELDELELHLLRRIRPGSRIALVLSSGHRCEGTLQECRRGLIALKTTAGPEALVRIAQIAAIESHHLHAAPH